MFRVTAGLLTGVLLTLTLDVQTADAQVSLTDGRPMVTASGSATIELSPERLRVNFKSYGHGKTLKDAFAALRKQREKDKALLRSLEADPESIRTGLPRVRSAAAAAQPEIQFLGIEEALEGIDIEFGAAIALEDPVIEVDLEEVPNQGDEDVGIEPQKIVVTSKISAEWPLKSQGVEELWILRHELSEKLKQRDAGGAMRAHGMTAEQLEALELAMGADPFGVEMGQTVSLPKFKFVAKVPPQPRQLAMKQAFRKARQNAEEIAASAGHSLGPLLTVSTTDPAQYLMAQYVYGHGQKNNGNSDRQNEVSGSSPGPLKRIITTDVSFQLTAE